MTAPNASSIVHFGGPGSPDGALRALLQERVDATPAGGEIDFVTYYLRDRALAHALVRAHERGARVRVALEARPRTPQANERAAAILHAGLGTAFRPIEHAGPLPAPRLPRPRLHTKLYRFSHPAAAFVGSFNPSSDAPELDPAAIDAIGDHDRGYNSLVELRDPVLVTGLAGHATHLFTAAHGRIRCIGARAARIAGDQASVELWPRRATSPMRTLVEALRPGDRARIAASHVSDPRLVRVLGRAARRGAHIALVSHTSVRRFPERAAARLTRAGATVQRIGDSAHAPMHEKFALFERPGRDDVVLFGSANWSTASQWLNHEIAVVSREPGVLDAYRRRWDQLTS